MVRVRVKLYRAVMCRHSSRSAAVCPCASNLRSNTLSIPCILASCSIRILVRLHGVCAHCLVGALFVCVYL